MNLRLELEERISKALARAGAGQHAPALVMPASRPEFGDYQANGVMAAAKRLKARPRDLAEKVLAVAELSDLAEKVEIAGPGFINIHLKADWLADRLTARLGDERLGAEPAGPVQTVVVDYSGPNLAKEMHVGHLRSTIIGDCLARVLEFLGQKVIRQNHVGDWGTQFGMLIAYMEEAFARHGSPGEDLDVALPDVEEFYQKAKQCFETDQAFALRAREYVLKLQQGDAKCRRLWRNYLEKSLDHCESIYRRLGTGLTRRDVRGESFYNQKLGDVISTLQAKGLLTESQGALCVFLDEFKGKDGRPLPVIVQKSDGAYLYATTDLAALRFRVSELKADRILYVTDSRQSLHFRQVFAVARKAGFAPPNVSLEHIPFGTMMGANGQPFKTRQGGTVKLMDLLDEAEQRALALVSEKNPDLSEQQKARIARAVGIGGVKYADLVHNRTSDYVFSWEKMLSLEGNTAPYMQYAYARIRSIFRKGELPDGAAEGRIVVTAPAERALAVRLMQFPETVEAVAADSLPHLLCGYLFELAGAFMSFYETCPVLGSDEPIRSSRVLFCDLTARTIRTGLGLLGIETIEQM